MSKMSFGEWMGAVIAGNTSARVMKIANSYFETDAVVRAAKEVDRVVIIAQMEGRKLSPFESLMMEILFDLADWKNAKEAHESYQRYLKEED
jgi:hypothetical protein